MLKCDDLSFTQDGFTLALSGEIAAGNVWRCWARRAAERARFCRLIAGFEWPDRGTHLVGRARHHHRPPWRTGRCRFLFQDGNLFPHLDVFDNVALGLRPDLRLSAADRAKVDDSLDQVGLGRLRAAPPFGALGGAAGAGRAGADAAARAAAGAAGRAVRRARSGAEDRHAGAGGRAVGGSGGGLTLVMACHDLRDAERLCDRLWLAGRREEGAGRADRGASRGAARGLAGVVVSAAVRL